ncbi:hypothetical protein [Providencia rettgeri]
MTRVAERCQHPCSLKNDGDTLITVARQSWTYTKFPKPQPLS